MGWVCVGGRGRDIFLNTEDAILIYVNTVRPKKKKFRGSGYRVGMKVMR